MAQIIKIFTISLLFSSVFSSKIESKIYQGLTNYHPCVLLTNATHQVGCTSDMKGNRGVVHLINDQEDINWLINEGPHKPYIPLLNYSFFREPVMEQLMQSGKINGVLVMHKNESSAPADGFSPDEICPLDKFGRYTGHSEYGNCQKVKWNKNGNGMSMVYYGIPIFLLTSKTEIDDLVEEFVCEVPQEKDTSQNVDDKVQCFNQNNLPVNGVAQSFPLCAVEMKDFMWAAKDTPTCQRKTDMANPIMSTYCDPLGDNNVVGTLYPVTGPLKQDDVIVVSARLDSTAFFHDFSPAADNGVTGIVALLAVAKALGNYKRKMKENNTTEDLKPILFALFNGEVWDYIGSSRVAWDMKQENFPYAGENPHSEVHPDDISDETYMSKINLKNIGYFIELSQIGLGQQIFAHTDPISQEDKQVKDKVSTILNLLRNASDIVGGKTIEVVDRDKDKQPLPPASFQRFLRERSIPGIVLADHQKEYSNQYYNSRYDNPENLGLQPTITKNTTHGNFELDGASIDYITNTSLVVANTLYLLASNGKPPKEKLQIDKSLVAHLLYCLLWAAKCPAFKEVLGKKSQPLPYSPLSRYISVKQLDNPITLIIHRLLAYYTGELLPEEDCSGKTAAALPRALAYVVVQGSNESHFVCVKHSTYLTTALSPAFEIKDYVSTEYSTWMESMWSGEMGIRMYLVADPKTEGFILGASLFMLFVQEVDVKVQGFILGAGLLMLFVTFAIVWFFTKKAFILFTPSVMILQS